MGTYVYHTLKSKKINVLMESGTQKVNLLKYTCRLSQYEGSSYSWGGLSKEATMLHARITKMENGYQQGDIKFVALGDQFEEGAEVFEWHEKSTNTWFDTDSLPKKVGTLKKEGRKWVLELTEEEKLKRIGEEFFFQ